MKSYKLIGLTGTTGAGKGETAEILRELGCEIISADFLAREIMKDRLVLDSLRLHFAAEALLSAEASPGSVTDIARMC